MAEANEKLATQDAVVAEAEAEASRLALQIEALRLDHLTEKFRLLVADLPDDGFKRELCDWNAGRLHKAAAGLYTRDVGGLRRLNDTYEQVFAEIVGRYFRRV